MARMQEHDESLCPSSLICYGGQLRCGPFSVLFLLHLLSKLRPFRSSWLSLFFWQSLLLARAQLCLDCLNGLLVTGL